jgi:hypothetical protein
MLIEIDWRQMIRNSLLLFCVLFYANLFSQSRINLIAPINEEQLFKHQVFFEWNASPLASNSTSYFLTVSTDSTLSNIVYSNFGTTFLEDSALLPNEGKYYWQVELVNNNMVIQTSAIQNFTVSNIYGISGLSVFLRADSGVQLDANNKISKWFNLADTSKSLIQNTPNSRPTLGVNSSGIKPSTVVRLDGIDDMLTLSNSFLASDFFVVANWGGPQVKFPSYNGLITGTSSYYSIIGNPVGNGTGFLVNSPNFLINNNSTNQFDPLGETKLISFEATSTAVRPDLQIGRDRTFSTRHWNGDVAEIMFFAAPLSDSLRGIVNKYLCQKYSSTLSLGPDIQVSSGFCDTLVQVDTNFTSYRWSNGDSTSSSLLTPGKTYQLTVTNNFGCTYTDEIYVTTPLKPEIDKLLCLGDSFTWDTELPKNEYSFLWSDNSTDSILTISQPGNYSVRITDANNCFLDSDTIAVQFDSTLSTVSLGPDTSLCLGYDIGLSNTPSGPINYSWNTNQTTPRIVPQANGVYWVDVSANECTVRDSIIITIKGDAPIADFTAPNVCFGDTAFFMDNSQNPTLGVIDTWRWDFGNGLSDTAQNTSIFYTNAQLYNVSLYVETDAQCSDSITKTFLVNPKPVAGFTNSLACVGDTIFFTDTSRVSSGGISSHLWKFNEPAQSVDTSIAKNPFFTFNTAKNYPIRLIVTSGLGCKDTTFKNLRINGVPVPDYTVSGNCLTDSTSFINQTVLPSGDQIAAIDWKFGNNSNASIPNPTIYYSIAKFYLVQLDVTTDKGCSASIKRQFEMNDKPVSGFTTTEFCLNNNGQVTDLSSVRRTSINQWDYKLIQGAYEDSSSLQNPSFTLNNLGDFNLTQVVTSAKGCKDSSSQNIPVRNNPDAFFNLETYLGATPFRIKFDSISPADGYRWSFGNGDSASVIRPPYSYTDTGIFAISLLLNNQFGCVDSMSRQVTVNPPNLDLVLDTVVVDQENNLVRIGVVLINSGNNEINSVRMLANLNSNYQLEETWTGQLFPNDFIYTEFTSSIVLSGNQQSDFACVQILSVNGESDLPLLKDEICVKGAANRLFLKAFPNPTEGNLSIEMVVPAEGDLAARVYDVMGKEQAFLFSGTREKGFYRFTVPSAAFMNGMYYLIVDFQGEKYKVPFIKQ